MVEPSIRIQGFPQVDAPGSLTAEQYEGELAMAWSLVVDQLPDLLAAFADVQVRLHAAFQRAVRPFGYAAPKPEIDPFHPDRAEWRIGWWLHLPDQLAPFEVFKCELDLREWSPTREVSGWIDVRRYVGHGVTVDDDLWRSLDYPVESPALAAVAIRRVAEEMAEQLGRLELGPYLAGTVGGRPAAADPDRNAGPAS